MFWMHVVAAPHPSRRCLRVWYAHEASLWKHVPLWLACTSVAVLATGLLTFAIGFLILLPLMLLLCVLLLSSIIKLIFTRLLLLGRYITWVFLACCTKICDHVRSLRPAKQAAAVHPALDAV